MSKNFELLQQVAKDDFFTPPGMPVPPLKEPRVPISAPLVVQRALPDDEIAKLVQRLFLHADPGGVPRVVSFSGITNDERSSWICARAGEALAAQVETSVCVVDANLWSPKLHSQFGFKNQSGLADALTAKGPIKNFAVDIGNIWMVTAGSVKADLQTQVERYRARFDELRKEFNYILVSAPPLTRETEATLIGQLTDGVVLIIEANQSRREVARQAKARLERAQIRLLGAVLDQRTFPIPEWIYRTI